MQSFHPYISCGRTKCQGKLSLVILVNAFCQTVESHFRCNISPWCQTCNHNGALTLLWCIWLHFLIRNASGTFHLWRPRREHAVGLNISERIVARYSKPRLQPQMSNLPESGRHLQLILIFGLKACRYSTDCCWTYYLYSNESKFHINFLSNLCLTLLCSGKCAENEHWQNIKSTAPLLAFGCFERQQAMALYSTLAFELGCGLSCYCTHAIQQGPAGWRAYNSLFS